jgi:hypothetical protein
MRKEDYGIIDSLTPEMVQAIDSAMIEFVSSRSRKAISIVRHMFEKSSAAISGLPDWFYMDRIVAEGEDERFHVVKACCKASVAFAEDGANAKSVD